MSRIGEQAFAIDYMPWADLDEELQIGPVSLWPFYAKAEQKIIDRQIQDDLTRFFETFVNNVGRPVQTIVVCSCGEMGFRHFSQEEHLAIRAAIDCLIFASIACGSKSAVFANNDSMAPPSADRFDLCARWIWPRQNGLTVATDSTMRFATQGKYFITQPISTGGTFLGDYRPLLEGLARTFDPAFPDDLRERLFRCLEWFRFAHTDSTVVSLFHKVVMMATAYEILLDLPDSGKRRYFIDQIHAKLCLRDSYVVALPDGHGGTFSVCKAGEWAGEFYRLRNDITHGDPVAYDRLQYKNWITHLIVADVVLVELVMRLLYEQRCIGEDLRQRVAEFAAVSPSPREAIEATLLPGYRGLDIEGVHETLGWIPPLDERRRKREEQLKNAVPEETDRS